MHICICIHVYMHIQQLEKREHKSEREQEGIYWNVWREEMEEKNDKL